MTILNSRHPEFGAIMFDDPDALRRRIEVLESALRVLEKSCYVRAAELVRLHVPESVPDRYADLVERFFRQPVVDVALALRDDARAAHKAGEAAPTDSETPHKADPATVDPVSPGRPATPQTVAAEQPGSRSAVGVSDLCECGHGRLNHQATEGACTAATWGPCPCPGFRPASQAKENQE